MLIATAGLAGAGKTTTLEVLSRAGFGTYQYVGGIVRSEVLALGLEPTPENEKLVRANLRDRHGLAAVAKLALPELKRRSVQGTVLVDAICNIEERDCYSEALGERLIVIGVQAREPIRAARLAARADRPISRLQLAQRDKYEIEELRVDHVLSSANFVISNEASLEELETNVLSAIASWLS